MPTFVVILAACCSIASGQDLLTQAERLQGYRNGDGLAEFVFDEAVYGIAPARVMVEGSMRGWKHDMSDTAWQLSRSAIPGIWTLKKSNLGYTTVPLGAEFKFRIDDGRWIDPPGAAPNVRGGNLVFAHTVIPVRMKADLVDARDVRVAVLEGDAGLSLDPSRWKLQSAKGDSIPIETVIWAGHDEVQIVPAARLDPARVYFLEDTRLHARLLCSFDGWMRHLYSGKELGANFDATLGKTVFRVFSPRATAVTLYVYRQRTGDTADRTIAMTRDDDGVWEAFVDGNLYGMWYDFTVHGPDDPGNEFYEQKQLHISDPYARVSDDSWGRSRVWRKTTPPRPVKGGIPKMEDVIAYEVHVEDFTLTLTGLDERKRGTFSGMVQTGLRNSHGEPIGIDHLTELGVNVVHLLPVQEYLHFKDDDWQNAFLHDPYMIAQDINRSNYQWGYRTSHALALETRYRTKGGEYGAQNVEFRDLVEAFHDRGIAVIVDMVFNHTAERIDTRELYFHMRVLGRHAYYRTGPDLNFIGEYGTETKSEDRPMTQRWIYDQCQVLINEFGVDGFRIDLAGLTDKQTLHELVRRIGRDKIVYGEPWIASSDPAFEANPDWNWYKKDAPITFFQDDTRNALCGPPDNPTNKRTDRGYAGGNGRRAAAKNAIANSFPEEATPDAGINYLDIHDNWALADRFARTNWNGELGVDEGPFRIAAAMLLTSLGPIVIHGGTEFMRSKGSAPLVELVKTVDDGPIFIHGKRDTYNLRRANLFQWENLGTNIIDGAPCNYERMNSWWKGLIALRRSDAGRVFRIGTRVPDGYIQWIEPADSMQLGYIIGGKVLVVINTADSDASISAVKLPNGSWYMVADGDQAGTAHLTGRDDSVLLGNRELEIRMPPTGVKIWVHGD